LEAEIGEKLNTGTTEVNKTILQRMI